MRVETVDLYAYFGINKPEKSNGFLTVYALDNNRETGLKRERSAMLILPGGGYEFVSDREGECVAIAFLQRGIQAFVLNYSVGKDFIYPTHLREAAMAMIFIRENAKKYHVNPEFVGAIGFSAGGHLCGCLGNFYNSPVLEDLRNRDFVRPTVLVLSYPVTVYGSSEVTHQGSFNTLTNCDCDLSKNLSLEYSVTKLSPPAFIWHTVNDGCVPVYGSIEMARKYNECKIPFELHLFEDGEHGLSVATNEVNSPNSKVAKWFELCIAWLNGRGFTIYS